MPTTIFGARTRLLRTTSNRLCHRNHPDGDASGLKWRINRNLQQSDFFDAYDRLDLDALVNPGQVTVLRMDGLSRRDQQVMAAVLLRKLYKAREAAVVGDPDDVRHRSNTRYSRCLRRHTGSRQMVTRRLCQSYAR